MTTPTIPEIEKAAWRVCNAFSNGPDETVTDWGLRLNQAIETLRVVLIARAKEQGK